MPDYPNRSEKYFANKLIRLLQKSCAANEIGIEACWLVTCIALVEDAKHYSGPVTFWTGQLLPITGFHSWGRLDRARERAVGAGWLHYRPGSRRQCGAYWCAIPESVNAAFNDAPVDDDPHQNGDHQQSVDHQNGDGDGDSNVIKRRLKRDKAVNLLPVPVPIAAEGASLPAAAATSRKKAKSRTPYPKHFEAVWIAYPAKRRKNKAKALPEYLAAVQRIAEADSGDVEQAAAWLLQRVTEFAASHCGRNFSPEPERWFRDDRFHDAPESWVEFARSTTANTDAKAAWQVLKKVLRKTDRSKAYTHLLKEQLEPNVFAAAESVGFAALFGMDQYNESQLFATFASALRPVAGEVNP